MSLVMNKGVRLGWNPPRRESLHVGARMAPWGSAFKGVGLGNAGGAVVGRNDGSAQIFLAENVYFDGANWRYFGTLPGSYQQQISGGWTVATVASGVAGNVATPANRLTVANAGNVTIFTPSSGIALTVNGATSTTAIQATDGTVTGVIAGFSSTVLSFGSTSNHPIVFLSNNLTRYTIGATGAHTVASPSSGVPLTVGGTSGADVILVLQALAANAAMSLNGTSTNAAYILFNNANGERGRILVDNSRTLAISIDSGATQALAINGGGHWVANSAKTSAQGYAFEGGDATYIALKNNSRGANSKYWAAMLGADSSLALAAFDDAFSGSATAIRLRRTGTTLLATQFNSGAYTTPVSVAFNSTLNIDARQSNYFEVGALTANITTFNVNNIEDGQTITVRFVQDGSGGRTVAAPAGAKISGTLASALNQATQLVLTKATSRLEGSYNQVPV